MLELMKNPETLMQMTFGEKMLGSLGVAALGLGTCFVVLAVLILCITIMHKKNEKGNSTSESKPAQVSEKIKPDAAAVLTRENDAVLDPAVVAAITAAIYKYKNGQSFRIVNITPAERKDLWSGEGKSRAFARRGSRLK